MKRSLRLFLVICTLAAVAATLRAQFPAPPDTAPVETLEGESASLATALRDFCLSSTDTHSEAAESIKVALMLALHPDTPNLESLVGGAWPYEWEGLECQLASVTAPNAQDIVARLYHSGSQRGITLYLFEWSSGDPRMHQLPSSELGIHNALFLLGDDRVLKLFASLSDTSASPFPVVIDLDDDGQQEVILHGLAEGLPGEGEEGSLYWPTVYRWQNGHLVEASDSYPKLYYDIVVPLYSGVLHELRREWNAAGNEGDHPTAARVDSLQQRQETEPVD